MAGSSLQSQVQALGGADAGLDALIVAAFDGTGAFADAAAAADDAGCPARKEFVVKSISQPLSIQPLKMFLKPFNTIMLNNLHSGQKEIKEYIVMCIAALCHQKAKFIKSGWEVILNIFTLAAQDTETHLVVQSF